MKRHFCILARVTIALPLAFAPLPARPQPSGVVSEPASALWPEAQAASSPLILAQAKPRSPDQEELLRKLKRKAGERAAAGPKAGEAVKKRAPKATARPAPKASMTAAKPKPAPKAAETVKKRAPKATARAAAPKASITAAKPKPAPKAAEAVKKRAPKATARPAAPKAPIAAEKPKPAPKAAEAVKKRAPKVAAQPAAPRRAQQRSKDRRKAAKDVASTPMRRRRHGDRRGGIRCEAAGRRGRFTGEVSPA